MYKLAILLVAVAFCAAQEQGAEQDEGNQIVLDTLHEMFNEGEKQCCDKCSRQDGLIDKAMEKKDFTEVAKCVGECSPVTAQLAELYNAQPSDVIASVAGALNDIYFRGCRVGKIIEDAGCQMPPMTYKRQDMSEEFAQEENAAMCDYVWCAVSALQEQKDPNCQAGAFTYYGVALHHAEMMGCVTY